MLIKWISEKEKDNLPAFATHFIGVGGIYKNSNIFNKITKI